MIGRIDGLRGGVVGAALMTTAACGTAPPATSSAAAKAHDAGTDGRLVVIISASAEWKAVRAHLPGVAIQSSPYGEWFETRFPAASTGNQSRQPTIFFHGGWGKVAAAGSTQYVIDRFRPLLLVNLGTCGGFEGDVAVGDVILVQETVIYDIVERMGDSSEAIADYTTRLDSDRWPARLRGRVRPARLLSADADLDPARLAELRARFGGIAGDWESGAIAWVASRNRTPLLVLRGVSDVVGASGDVTYGDFAAFERAAHRTMKSLLDLLGEALPDLVSGLERAPAS
jgi:adenosylhomocysteine nucleosidase